MLVLEVLPKFLVQLDADGRGWSIREQYTRHIRTFDAWLVAEKRSRDVGDLTHETVAAFFASPDARLRPDGEPKKTTSLNVMRGSIRNFGRYLHLAGYAATDPARLLRRARCRNAAPRWLSPEESDRLLATLAADKTIAGKRDRMFVELLLGTGVRLSTALALTDADVDLPRRLLALREMKGSGGAADVLPISAGIATKLRAYLRGRPPGPLFDNGHGEPLGRRQAATRLRLWGTRADLSRPLAAHALRHTFARRAYERCRDVFTVKELLRHRSVVSTLVYASVDQQDLRRALA